MDHQVIMRREVLDYLIINPSGFYVDATFGDGGHSCALLEALDAKAQLLALDRDKQAIIRGAKLFSRENRLSLRHQRFSLLAREVAIIDRPLCGVLMDIGLSSRQLDDAARGFSFSREGPLDMRMDRLQKTTAATLLARFSAAELIAVLRDYGEEPQAARIAALVMKRRSRQALNTTRDLVEAVRAAIPSSRMKQRNTAARVFQALRILVNDELWELEQGLHQAAGLLMPGGRLVVISFHSLEHRIIKKLMKSKLSFGEGDSRGTMKSVLSSLKPQRWEISHNSRARRAVMRVMEKKAA